MNNKIQIHPGKTFQPTPLVNMKQTDASLLECEGHAFVSSDSTSDIIDQALWCTQFFTENALSAFQLQTTRQAIYAQERKQQGLDKVCEDCGRSIPEARLRARPTATRCIQCQALFERRGH